MPAGPVPREGQILQTHGIKWGDNPDSTVDMLYFDQKGNLVAHVGNGVGSFVLPGGAALRSGSGAPSNSLGDNGDLYIDKSATAATSLYQKSGGSWGLLPTSGGAPSGAAGGSLTGNYPSPTIAAGAVTSSMVDSTIELTAHKNAASGYAGLDSSTLLTAAQMGTNTPGQNTYLLGNRTWGSVPYFNVMTYGAKGDGSTDDTSAINSAIAAAAAASPLARAEVIFPQGNYLVSSAIVQDNDYITLRGVHQLGSVLSLKSGVSDVAAVLQIGKTRNVQFPMVVNLGISAGADGGHTTGHGILADANSIILEHVLIDHAPQDGFNLNPSVNSFQAQIADMYVLRMGRDGMYVGPKAFDSDFYKVVVAGTTTGAQGGRYGVYNQGSESHFYGCHPFFMATAGYYCDTGGVQIIGGETETCALGIHIITPTLPCVIADITGMYNSTSADMLLEFITTPLVVSSCTLNSTGNQRNMFVSNVNDAVFSNLTLNGSTFAGVTFAGCNRLSLSNLKCLTPSGATYSIELQDSSRCEIIGGGPAGANPKPIAETHASGTSSDHNMVRTNLQGTTCTFLGGNSNSTGSLA